MAALRARYIEGRAVRLWILHPPPLWALAELLYVEVDVLARARHLHAPDRDPRRPVEVVEKVEVVAYEHPVHRRDRAPDDASDARRAEALVLAQREDALLH